MFDYPFVNFCLFLVLIVMWFFTKNFIEKLEKEDKPPSQIRIVKRNIFTLNFGFGNSILTPIVSSFVLFVVLFYSVNVDIASLVGVWGLFWVMIISGLIAPLAEEITFRGFIFGLVISLIEIKIKKKWRVWLIILALLGQTFLFMAWHSFFIGYQFGLSQFLGGLLFGSLYLMFRKNLLPGIVAHMSLNWLMIIYYLK